MKIRNFKRSFFTIFLLFLLAVIIPLMSMPQTLIAFADTIPDYSSAVSPENQYNFKDFKLPNDLQEEAIYDETEIIAEDISKRTATSKTFIQANGTLITQFYGTEVHYFDGKEFKEIDNTINRNLQTTANSFNVNFNQSREDAPLIYIDDGIGSISMAPMFEGTDKDIAEVFIYNGFMKATRTEIVENIQLQYNKILSDSISTLNIKDRQLEARLQGNLAKVNSSIYFSNIYANVDIQYILEGKSLKENIIVNAPLDEYSFKFELNLKNFYAYQLGEEIYIFGKEDNKLSYVIPKGYMTDANGIYSDDVYYDLEFNGSSYYLTVKADADFFDGCTFPVYIDPSVTIPNANRGQYWSGNSNTTFSTTTAPRSVFIDLNSPDIAKFVAENMICNAELSISYGTNNRNFQASLKHCLDYKQLWAWEGLAHNSNNDFILPLQNVPSNTNRILKYDVAPYLNGYLEQSVISIRETGNLAVTFSNLVLTIEHVSYFEYLNNLSDYFITQDLGTGGMGIVNIYNGKLNYEYEDIIISDGGFLPINISHIYDDNFRHSYSAGHNFKLNIQQRIVFDGWNYYYINAQGRSYYFSSGTVHENKELGLKLYKNNNIIRLIDRQGNSLVFDENQAGDNLIEIHQYPSRYEQKINSMHLKLTYNGKTLATVSNNYTTLNFEYLINGQLTSIKDGFATLTSYNYTPDALFADTYYILRKANNFGTGDQNTTTFDYFNQFYKSWPLMSVTSANGEKVSYVYSQQSSNNEIVVNSVQTENINIPYSTSTINISHINNTTSTSISKTVIVGKDNTYFRHISFNGLNVVSDYAFEKEESSFIPHYTESNNFDLLSFVDTYGNLENLLDVPNITVNSNRTITETRTGILSYAVSVWLKKPAGTAASLVVTCGGKTETYNFNTMIADWQFVTVVIKDVDVKSFTVRINCTTASAVNFGLVRVDRFAPKPVAAHNNMINLKPMFDSKGRLVTAYQHNILDNEISKFVYTYLPASFGTEYPDLIQSITEYTVSATITNPDSGFSYKSQIVYTYNSRGQLTQIQISPSLSKSNYTDYSYYTSGEWNGNLWSYSAEGVTIVYTYPDGKTKAEVLGYGANSIVTTTEYRKGSGLLKSTTTGDITTSFIYNAFGSLWTISHNGFSTIFNYYTDGSLKSIQVPGRLLASYSYSENQDTVTYGNNQSEKYNYNNKNQLTSITNESNAAIATFGYNNSGQLTSITNNITGVSYIYTPKSELSASQFLVNSYSMTNNNKTMRADSSFADAKGNYVSEGYYYQNILSDSYFNTYNDNGKIKKTYKGNNNTIDYGYDSHQRLEEKRLTSGTRNFTNTYSYQSQPSANYTDSRIFGEKFIVESGGSANLQTDFAYTYYSNGLLACITDLTKPAPNNFIAEYFYDQYGRLTQELNHQASRVYLYAYDNGGNILQKKQYSFAGILEKTIDYAYDSAWKDLLVNYNGQALIYDGAGNPTSYKGSMLTWQNGRQLASYGNSSYQYDFAGIRTRKTVNGQHTYYYVEGSRIWAEETNNILTWYYYDETGIQGMRYEGAEYYFNKNMLGDVMGIYRSDGTYVGGYTYDAWGNITSQTSHPAINANPFRYRGYYYDQETGLYYLNSRYYDSETARFINADEPTMLYSTASTFGGANLYSYCFNNPISNIDPNGNIALVDDLAYLLVLLFFVGAVVYVESEYHPIEKLFKQIAVSAGDAVNAVTQWLGSSWSGGASAATSIGTVPWVIKGAIDKYTFKKNDPYIGKYKRKLTAAEREKLRNEIHKQKKGESRGGKDNLPPSDIDEIMDLIMKGFGIYALGRRTQNWQNLF